MIKHGIVLKYSINEPVETVIDRLVTIEFNLDIRQLGNDIVLIGIKYPALNLSVALFEVITLLQKNLADADLIEVKTFLTHKEK